MIFKRRPRGRTDTSRSERKPRRFRRILIGVFDVSLVLAVATLVVYVGLIARKVFGGYSAEEPTPAYTMRLQIVDASPAGIALKKLAPEIEAVSDMKLEIKVAESNRFKVRPVTQSFVISRMEDLTAARLLATRLGLDPGNVEYKPLEDNRGLITATLVVGADGVKMPVANKKET